mgnify:CR=1 FL=1
MKICVFEDEEIYDGWAVLKNKFLFIATQFNLKKLV